MVDPPDYQALLRLREAAQRACGDIFVPGLENQADWGTQASQLEVLTSETTVMVGRRQMVALLRALAGVDPRG